MVDEPVIARLMQPVDEFDHITGPADAAATLVQYGDYECPYCRELHPLIKELLQRAEGLRFVYRHFPLVMHHPFAARAAEAAEAGSAQGKFWEMHDAIYESKPPLEDPRLRQAA